MNSTERERFLAFRKRVFDLIKKTDDGYHKSYEGAMDVRYSYSNIYESEENVECLDFVEIELHCYLLVNGRHITWGGRTFDRAMEKAESWLKDTECILNSMMPFN